MPMHPPTLMDPALHIYLVGGFSSNIVKRITVGVLVLILYQQFSQVFQLKPHRRFSHLMIQFLYCQRD